MNKDQRLLESLYEQVLINESSSIIEHGFSKPFAKAVHEKYNVPHDIPLTQLSKLPTKDQIASTYSCTMFKTKEGKEIFIYRYGGDVSGRLFNATSSELDYIYMDYGKMKGAADKSTIFACETNLHITSKKDLDRTKYDALTEETFELMHSKFGDRFVKEIESIKDFIYENIRHFKVSRKEGPGQSELGDIVRLLDMLERLKVRDSFITRRTYQPIIQAIAQSRNATDEDFIKKFEQNPSFSNLAYLYLKELRSIKDDVLVIYYADELEQYPKEDRKAMLKKLLKDKATDKQLSQDFDVDILKDF